MFPDVVDLRSFYAQPLGVVTRRLINHAIRARFDDVRGLAVLGMGYATPYLGVFREECERTLAFMPGAQGVTRWPSAAPTLAALVDETELPLRDAGGSCAWCLTGVACGRGRTTTRSAMAGLIRAARSLTFCARRCSPR